MVESWKAEGEAKAIITFLNAQFKKVPKEITDRVTATTDLIVLESLTDLVATCGSLDEFRKAWK